MASMTPANVRLACLSCWLAAVAPGFAGRPVAAVAHTSAPSPQATPACRIYTTAATRTFTASGSPLSGTISETCTYNPSSNEHACTLDYRDSRSVSYRMVVVRRYEAVADFVDEVRVIPPISRAMAGSTRYTPSGPGARDSSQAFSYDAQRRLTQLVIRSSGGPSQTMTYEAWDAAGRPTSLIMTAGRTFDLRYSYDDGARTMTIETPSIGAVQTHTFDENGNQVREVSSAGGVVTTYAWAIAATEKICRQ
jgi:YD repeat-containing protein